ncbi:MAG: acyltransferase [Actinobacteria bacterium]|nr:acyltransferase [Actinomycetota bacterium]
MSPNVSIRHVPALDGLRGLAVAAVLLFHAGHLDGGYLGVDLFFVLSGFLITTLLLVEVEESGRVRLGGFWARRARRLLPALAGVLVGVSLYALLVAEPSELDRIRAEAFATVAYAANWRAVFTGHDYWSLFQTPSPLEHTWSLAIEEQFYVVWPLVIVGLLAWWKRSTPKAVLAVAIALAAVSTSLMVALHDPQNPSRVYYGTDTRAAAVLYGAALASALVIWGPVRTRRARRALDAGGLAGAALLALAWFGLDGSSSTLYHGGFVICGLAATVVIAAAVHPEAGVVSRALGWRPLCLLGLVSYGVYLWHWPVFLVIDANRTGLTGWWLFAARCAVTGLIAVASYLLLEMPVRRGALKPRSWRTLLPAGAIGLVVLLLVTTAGGSDRPAAAQAKANPMAVIDGNSTATMQLQRKWVDSLVPPSRPRVLMTGDSVALTLSSGAPREATSPFAVTSATIIGCGISTGAARGLDYVLPGDVCKHWPEVWERGLAVFHPRAVVLLSGTWDVQDQLVNGQTLRSMSPELREHLLVGLRTGLRLTDAAGARFVLLTAPCFAPVNTGRAAAFENLSETKRIKWFNDILMDFAAAHPGSVDLIDFGGFICPDGQFQRSVGGVMQRPDGIHFSTEGARRAWRWLAPRLTRVLETVPAPPQ